MRNRWLRLLVILFILIGYTEWVAAQLWPDNPAAAGLFALLMLFIMISWQFTYRLAPQYLEKLWFKIFTWVGSITMGFWATFVLLSILANTVYFMFSLTPFDLLHFTQQQLYLSVLVVTCLITAIGFVQAYLGPRVKQVLLTLEGVPTSFRSLRIVQISDLHVGPTIQKEYVQRVVDQVNGVNPDLIFITGDIADGLVTQIQAHLKPLSDLKSRLGVFYVPGNHEYYWGALDIIAEIKKLGFQVLMNENRICESNGKRMLIAGISDPAAEDFLSDHKPNLLHAAQTSESVDLKILLSHRPDPHDEAEKLGFHLQFSGHTHAGQFFPFNVFIPFVHKYYKGVNQHGKLIVYVNPGTGYWGPANRFGIPPEITLVVLS